MLATETPLCTGRARDIYYECELRGLSLSLLACYTSSLSISSDGYAPFIRLTPPSEEPSIIFQTESFSDPPAVVGDAHPREYRCVLTTGSKTDETFEIEYDTKRMYQEGISVNVEGEGVEVSDDGKGRVKVTTKESNKEATVVITPK